MARKPRVGGAREGAGRPPKTGEARTERLPVKVSPTELDELRARADREGRTLADLVRSALRLAS